MNYKGKHLTPWQPAEIVLLDKPKRMLVWDFEDSNPVEDTIYAYFPGRIYPCQGKFTTWKHCAEIPEARAARRATNRELAKWLAQGNGERRYVDNMEPDDGDVLVSSEHTYYTAYADRTVDEEISVRKWDDVEWHEPTADYLGLEA